MSEICKNCHFYSEHSYGKGLCKRHAPVISSAPKDLASRGSFPVVYEKDRCGDFKQTQFEVDKRYTGYL